MQTVKQPLSKWRDSDSEASSAQTESLDDDSDFELAPAAPLLLRPRQSRALLKPRARVPARVPAEPESPEEFGLGIENLHLDKVRNKNVVFGAVDAPPRRLRPAASMMLRSEDPHATLKLRSAKSMWQVAPQAPQGPAFPQEQVPPHPQEQVPPQVYHRPLTVYAEPKSKPRHRTSRRIQLIKPQQQQQQPDTVNGMVFNPASGEWEGNDDSTLVFDTVKPSTSRRNMLVNLKPTTKTDSMEFDSVNLCWVPRGGAGAQDDPFAGIQDLEDSASTASTPMLGRSTMSSSSRRDASSPLSTFKIPSGVQRLWLENDQRFARKFGSWIEGSQDIKAIANDLYKMVN